MSPLFEGDYVRRVHIVQHTFLVQELFCFLNQVVHNLTPAF